nr:ABC transporter ATP-binding protein [uncultured Ruminococcus sp.]
MSLVEFRDVYKRYQMGEITINAVDGISFSVEEGEFAVVASGAGKTTVLNILGGMDSCTEGEIIVGGRNVSRLSDRQLIEYRRYDIGFVFQFYNLVHNLTAKENVELAAQICRDPMDSEKALESVGLLERKDNFPAQLSGGEQQRVSIARALAKNPKLLLCDEPTGALDYNTGRQILALLQDTCHRQKMTVMLITHNNAITPMADHVIEMKSGKIVRDVYYENPKSIDEIEW